MKANWFIAFPVPGFWLPQILQHLPESCRPFHPSDLHMTVAFLGALEPNAVLRVERELEETEAFGFEYRLGSLLTLPSNKRVSALSFSLREGKEEAATRMAALRDGFYKAAGQEPDPRPPLPHITVARPKYQARKGDLTEVFQWVQTTSPPDILLAVDELALYTWSDQRPRIQFKTTARKQLSFPED